MVHFMQEDVLFELLTCLLATRHNFEVDACTMHVRNFVRHVLSLAFRSRNVFCFLTFGAREPKYVSYRKERPVLGAAVG